MAISWIDISNPGTGKGKLKGKEKERKRTGKGKEREKRGKGKGKGKERERKGKGKRERKGKYAIHLIFRPMHIFHNYCFLLRIHENCESLNVFQPTELWRKN